MRVSAGFRGAFAGVLLIALAGPAAAHVVFNQDSAKPGELTTAELRVTHGCSGSPTVELTVQLPEGVSRVTPRVIPGWEVSVAKRALNPPVRLHGEMVTETVASITWKGGNVPEGTYEQFEFRFQTPNSPGQTLYFPVAQVCREGRHDWTAIPGPGQSWGSLPEPAPFIRLNAAPPAAHGGGHGHH